MAMTDIAVLIVALLARFINGDQPVAAASPSIFSSNKCGDYLVQHSAGEECDAGPANGLDGVGCRSDCTLPVCGDGHRAPGEYCDDGNLVNGDGCDKHCATEHTFPTLSEPKGAVYEVAVPDAATLFGDPCVTLQRSEHFVLRALFDDQDLLEKERKNGGTLSNKNQRKNLETFEEIWAKVIDGFGFAAPYFDRTNKEGRYTVNVIVSDWGYLSGGTFQEGSPWPEGQHPHVQMVYHAFDAYFGMVHEFTHALQNMLPSRGDWFPFGGWFSESHAEFMTYQTGPGVDALGCSEVLVNGPHLYYGTTRNRYCNWQFWDYLTDNFGIEAVNSIWSSSLGGPTDIFDEDIMDCAVLDGPFSVLKRNLGWTIEQLNDLFGQWAMANVNWDYNQKGHVYQDGYGSYSENTNVFGNRGRLTRLESVNNNKDDMPHYVPPELLAPQRWGYNIVRLIPDDSIQTSGGSITVHFRGVVQSKPARTKKFGAFNHEPDEIPLPDSGWRWGLVAIDATDSSRRSPLQAGARASLRFEVKPDDRELYLVVVGAPTSLHQIMWDQMYYSIYRYPWRIRLENAVPQGFEPTEHPAEIDGESHPNGGGFVASTASVAAGAYVGPDARILENANIGKNVRIEGHAIVGGDAKIMGNAIVKDHAFLVGDNTLVTGNAVVHGSVQMRGGEISENAEVGGLTFICCNTKIYGSARVISTNIERPLKGDARIFGNVQLLGDIEFHVDKLSSGVWYGFVHPEFLGDPTWGADRTKPEDEVTVSTDGMDWDSDDADCRYTHVGGCPDNKSCVLVGDTYKCKTGATTPHSYERNHTQTIIECMKGGTPDDGCISHDSSCFAQIENTKGCDDDDCERKVCDKHDKCCNKKWNKKCRLKAKQLCLMCPCEEGRSAEFFWKMKNKEPIINTCEWLVRQSKKKRKNICKRYEWFNENGDAETGPARRVCPITCDLKVCRS